jgi:hypothetical protein
VSGLGSRDTERAALGGALGLHTAAQAKLSVGLGSLGTERAALGGALVSRSREPAKPVGALRSLKPA